jgi:hypothetical protein
MLSYLQVHLFCDACIIMLATIIIYAPFHKCTPSYDNTSRKQSSHMEQFQQSRKLYNKNHLDKTDPIFRSNRTLS